MGENWTELKNVQCALAQTHSPLKDAKWQSSACDARNVFSHKERMACNLHESPNAPN